MALCARAMPLQLTGSEEAPISISLVRCDGAGDNSYTERRPTYAPAVIETDPQLAPLPPLPTGAQDLGAETLPLAVVPLSPRRERRRR